MATSKFLRTFRTTTGTPITAATIWLVPQSDTYPTNALALTPHATRDGQYYRDNVPDGEYKIYIDPAGGSSPTLYDEHIWLGEQRVTTISDHFDAADSYKLKASGIQDQTKTVTSLTSPTPDYIGQVGDDGINEYTAIALAGTMWAPKRRDIFADYFSFYYEEVTLAIRKAVKSIQIIGAIEGYVYSVNALFKNPKQLNINRIKLSDSSSEAIVWYQAASDESGIKEVIFNSSDANYPLIAPTIKIILDFDIISGDGGGVTDMVINPKNYIYQSLVQPQIDSIALLEREIPTNPTIYYNVANGAVAIENGITIPAGQTGYQSFFNMNPRFADDPLFTEFEGKSLKATWKFITTTNEVTSFDIHFYGGGLPDYNINPVIDTTNKIITASKIYSNSAALTSAFYIQIMNNSMLATDWTILFIGLTIEPQEDAQIILAKGAELYKTQKQILKVLDEYRFPYIPAEIIKITVAMSGVADFLGTDAIQTAIDSISDASIGKQYEIYISEGVYEAVIPSEFTKACYGTEKAFILGKDYVHLIGAGKDKTIIKGYLSPTGLGIGFDYGLYQTISWDTNSRLENLSVVGQNLRYPIHIEGSFGSIVDKIINFNNLNILHKGNTDDALASWSATFCLGIGITSGYKILISNSKLESAGLPPVYLHTNPYTEKATLCELDNCELVGGTISVYNWGSKRANDLVIKNPTIQDRKALGIASLFTANQINSDDAEINIIMPDTEPLAMGNTGLLSRGLRIKSKTTGLSSSVRVDWSCNAFTSIIGDTADSEVRDNQYNWKTQYGYFYKDGGVGLAGFAIGGIDVDESGSGKSLGARLGDCSSINKYLVTTIDGISRSCTFNTNLTSATNDDVLAIINASAIGTYAVVDLYKVGMEAYPVFKGNTVKTNSESDEILAGMGVIWTSGCEMRKALNSDNRIDGICLDDTPAGSKGRVIICGNIYSSNSAGNTGIRFKIKEVSTAQRLTGSELGISTSQPGFFDISSSPKILKAIATDILEIIR